MNARGYIEHHLRQMKPGQFFEVERRIFEEAYPPIGFPSPCPYPTARQHFLSNMIGSAYGAWTCRQTRRASCPFQNGALPKDCIPCIAGGNGRTSPTTTRRLPSGCGSSPEKPNERRREMNVGQKLQQIQADLVKCVAMFNSTGEFAVADAVQNVICDLQSIISDDGPTVSKKFARETKR